MIPTAEKYRKEALRKLFHTVIVIAFIPIAAIAKGLLVLGIVTCLVLYLFHESYVHSGGSIPFITDWIGKLKRLEEKKIAYAPFLMGAGIVMTVVVFPFRPAAAGLLQLACCDMAAALVGMKWGQRKLPYSPDKSLEGTTAYFVMALILMPFLFFSLKACLILALAGALIESLPFKDWDNFLIPVGVAALASFF